MRARLQAVWAAACEMRHKPGDALTTRDRPEPVDGRARAREGSEAEPRRRARASDSPEPLRGETAPSNRGEGWGPASRESACGSREALEGSEAEPSRRARAAGCPSGGGAPLAAVVLLLWSMGTPARALAQPPGAAHAAQAAEGGGEGRGTIDMVARAVNFAILAGTLWYLLRSPIAKYLADRQAQIRSDLVHAAEMRRSAAAEVEEIDRRMKALPAELDALRAQGAQEMAAEAERIRAAAAAERDRLLEQARREIDLQVKVAERALVRHAADLAVGVASDRIKRNITDEDQRLLVDRYVQQLKG